MFTSLKDKDLLFFSPACNSLPRHVRIDFLPVRFLKQVGVSLWLHLNASRIIAEYGLDKLNVHSGPGGVLCIRRLPIPLIVTCHHTYRQQCRHLPSQIWKRLFIPFESRTYRLADKIAAVSEATRVALVEQYGIPAHKVTVIHNAVDPNMFHPMGSDKESNLLLYVGRIDRRKGIDFLIESMPLVLKRIPDARLLVAGRGGWLKRMKALAGKLGLERNVQFLGFVPDDQLNMLYHSAQCVVVPSVFEGFGITVIEALAAGTRVIGSDVDGIREILAGGSYGRLVPYGDTLAMAEAIASELKEAKEVGALRCEYLVDEFRNGYQDILDN